MNPSFRIYPIWHRKTNAGRRFYRNPSLIAITAFYVTVIIEIGA